MERAWEIFRTPSIISVTITGIPEWEERKFQSIKISTQWYLTGKFLRKDVDTQGRKESSKNLKLTDRKTLTTEYYSLAVKQQDRKYLKYAREKHLVPFDSNSLSPRSAADYWAKFCRPESVEQCVKVLQGNHCQPRLQAQQGFRIKEETKTFPDKQKWRDFIAKIPTLQRESYTQKLQKVKVPSE